MAQPGSATVWGTGGRVFESRLPDERTKRFSFFDGILHGVLISLRSNDYCKRQFSYLAPLERLLQEAIFESRLPDERTKRFSFFDGILHGVLISLRSNDYCKRQFSYLAPLERLLQEAIFESRLPDERTKRFSFFDGITL